MVLGAIDKIIGNRFGLGKQFEEGFMAMGALALAMIGIISLAPVIAHYLAPVLTPVYQLFGADPAMFAGSFLANDMGGYPLAQNLAINPSAGLFAGLFVSAMMGATIVFTIPVALGIIHKSDRHFLALGILFGLITMPIGAFVGGLAAGFDIIMIISNLTPVLIISILLSVGLWKIPQAMIKGFEYFGLFITTVITIGLVAAIIEALTGFSLIPGMASIDEGVKIIGSIAIVLAGAYPLVYAITKIFGKQLTNVGKRLGINKQAAAGLIASLANNIPMFSMMHEMDSRGKVINVAFAVSAAFVLGDHLGFTAGVQPDMIFAVIVGKLTGGLAAVLLAYFALNKYSDKLKAS